MRSSVQRLSVLHNADLGGPQDAAVQVEALLLGEEDGAVLLARLRSHEDSLVNVGVELVAGLGGIEALQAVLLQRADQDAVGHLDTLVQRAEVLVVDRLDEVTGEALDGKVLGGLGLARGALLQVAEVGDGAEVLVLPLLSAPAPILVSN